VSDHILGGVYEDALSMNESLCLGCSLSDESCQIMIRASRVN
jgi:hypothetical protein